MLFFVVSLIIIFLYFLTKFNDELGNKNKRIMDIVGHLNSNDDNLFSKYKIDILRKIGDLFFRFKFFSGKYIEKIKFINGSPIDYSYFFGFKFACAFSGCFFGFILNYILNCRYPYIFMFVCSFFLFFFPDFILVIKRRSHLRKVEDGMADALDLFLVCAEGGLPMEASIECVYIEMRQLNPDVSDEFKIILDEMKMGSDRSKALENIGLRTGLDIMKRLSNALIQTFETGAPLASVLRVLVFELRQDSLIKFEEKAARLSVLLTFPMILFILPCVFIVICGPAVLGIFGIIRK